MVGPTGRIWLTSDINIARNYSKSNGAIVVIQVDPSLTLTNSGTNIYTYEVSGAVTYQEYYHIYGLRPVAVLNPKGERIG